MVFTGGLCTKHYTIHMVAISVTLISETTKRKRDGKKKENGTERKARRRAKKSNTCHPRGGGDPVNDVYSFVDPPFKPEEN